MTQQFWVITSPLKRQAEVSTFGRTRNESIRRAGASDSKQWRELYDLGYRAEKVKLRYV